MIPVPQVLFVSVFTFDKQVLYIYEILKFDKLNITKEILEKFLKIESITGKPFKRLFKSITGCDLVSETLRNGDYYFSYREKYGFYWEYIIRDFFFRLEP